MVTCNTCDCDDDALERRINELVDQLLHIGCEIEAVGAGYCINEPLDPKALVEMSSLLKKFGPRNHLVAEFNRVLAKRGLIIKI